MSARPLSTVLKCFDLLEAIAGLPGPGRLSELARMVGESRATTYQRLLTLTTAGWTERLSDGSYRLSMRASRIANAALEQAGFGERAVPVLDALTEETGETSSLAVLENGRLVIAQRVEARGVLRADLRVGAEPSFAESASGRVWTAFGPQALRDRLARDGVRTAPKPVLRKIKADGVAVGGGGDTLQGISVAAVPVLDSRGRCLASLSLVAPETRFAADRLIPPLRAAAARLSAVLEG